MIKDLIISIVQLIILILFQVLILDNISLWGFCTPFVYIWFVLLLPYNTSFFLRFCSHIRRLDNVRREHCNHARCFQQLRMRTSQRTVLLNFNEKKILLRCSSLRSEMSYRKRRLRLLQNRYGKSTTHKIYYYCGAYRSAVLLAPLGDVLSETTA